MKITTPIILFALLLVGCEIQPRQPFVGYLVCKEYVKHHMSNEEPNIIQQAVVFVPRIPHRPKPKQIPSEWKFYVANKYGTKCFNVDSMTYLKCNIGDKLTFY